MFSSKDADKKVGSSGIPKVIQPGNVVARVIDITLDVPPYDSTAYNLLLHLETLPLGEGFEGFAIDKDTPELGTYKGQIGRVQTQQYSYSDYTNKDGQTTAKSDMIFRWLWNFAKEIGITDILKSKNVEGATIEEFLENAKPYLISSDRYLHFCICGSPYENSKGYTQYRLFLPKMSGNKKGFELYLEGHEPSKLIMFNEAEHIKTKKPVETFSGRDAASGSDLDLD
jgi:hypothetical protein